MSSLLLRLGWAAVLSLCVSAPAQAVTSAQAFFQTATVAETLPVGVFPFDLPVRLTDAFRAASLAPSLMQAPQTSSVIPLPLARPEGHAVAPVANVDYDVFGSVALKIGSTPSMPKWLHAVDFDTSTLPGSDCSADPGFCSSRFYKTVHTAIAAAGASSSVEALAIINRAVNHAITYKSDQQVWGVADYWADPDEIARKGAGDCEDFAIAKLWALRTLGLAASQLQLIVLDDTRTRAYHAVLAAHVDGQTYILDNLTDGVSTDAAFPNYRPIMSFAGSSSYIHGFKAQQPVYASIAGTGLGEVAPGEGE